MRIPEFLVWLPRRVQREFKTRGGETRFLIWVSFLLTFIWARLTILYLEPGPSVGVPGELQFGGRTVIFGYHPHHIVTGIVLLALAGWVGLHYSGKGVTRVAGVMYGMGLGLIVDEAGFVVEGFTYMNDFPEVFVIVVVVGALFMSTVYFPSFWRAIHQRVFRWYKAVVPLALRMIRRPRPPAITPAAPKPDAVPAPVPQDA